MFSTESLQRTCYILIICLILGFVVGTLRNVVIYHNPQPVKTTITVIKECPTSTTGA